MEELSKEDKILSDSFQVNIDEFKKMSDFLKVFVDNFKNFSIFEDKKPKGKKENISLVYQSILLTGLTGIYDSFKSWVNNIKGIMQKIENGIIKPLDEFRFEQLKIYKDDLNKIKEINKIYTKQNYLLDKARYNYYISSQQLKKDNNNENVKRNFKNEDIDNSLSNSIKNKMIAKNYENIYRYELARYNSIIYDINNNYNTTKTNFEMAEKNRILFIKESFDKFKTYISDIKNEFDSFINVIDKYCSSDICDKENQRMSSKINQFKKEELRLPLSSFISFKDFYENNKEKLNNNKYSFDIKYEGFSYDKEISKMKNKEVTDFYNNVLDDLLKKEDINPEKNLKLFDIIQSSKKEEYWNLLIDCLMNKYNELSTMKFRNLKNMEYLSNCLNYILLRQDSIFKGYFELNVKMIFLAVKLFYQNEENNDKIYLSAVLSKNKYLRTSQFWRNILEFKLANKLCDAITRLNDVFTFKGEKKKTLLNKIGLTLGLNNPAKNSFLSKTRILPLIQHYNELDKTKIDIIDKIALQEMLNVIKDNIPEMMSFNFPTELCLDLIAKLIEEYKISKKNIKYLVIYTNVCSCSIRKILRNEQIVEKNKISNFKKPDGKIKLFKLLKNAIPYLNFEDYNKLLLCSKQTNQKLKKKIYAHVLRQKEVDNKVRLYIWEIF